MNLNRIEAFLAVADNGNISRAAAQLGVAQSVLSRHVKGFEQEIGAPLFERTGRGVAMTAAAERLAPRLRAALLEMEQATAEAADASAQPGGVVRLGVVPSAVHPLVGMLYQRVHASLPRIQLQFTEGFSGMLDKEVATGALDLAVVHRYRRSLRPGDERLCEMATYVIGAPGSLRAIRGGIALRDLASLPLVLAPRPNVLRTELDERCREMGVRLRVPVESGSLLIMKDLISLSGFFTLLPRQAVRNELEHGSLQAVRLADPGMPRTLVLLSGAGRTASAAARAVAHEIRKLVQSPPVGDIWR